MVALTLLWLPIVLSAVAVFVASSLIHMVLGYHKSDFGRLPNEDATMAALRPLAIPPGDYFFPFATAASDMKDPAFLDKVNAGPRIVMTVLPPGMSPMGPLLARWFVFSLVVSLFAGYAAASVLAPGTAYLTVFRLVGTVAFAGYALGAWPASIWYGKSATATVKGTFDGLVYALLTAGVFGWCWPSA